MYIPQKSSWTRQAAVSWCSWSYGNKEERSLFLCAAEMIQKSVAGRWSQANKIAHLQKKEGKKRQRARCFTSSVPSNPPCLRCYSGRWRWRPGAPPPCVRRWCLSTQCHLSLQVRLNRGTWCVHYEFRDMWCLDFRLSLLLLLSFQLWHKPAGICCYLSLISAS